MSRAGVHYNLPPQPPVLEDTTFIDAGCITIGVEYRELDNESLLATYKGTDFEEKFTGAPPGWELFGVSLHVVDRESDWEYLRFDCFEGDEHYHYIHRWDAPEDVDNHVVWWDTSANDRMLPWALDRIRHHLPAMLIEAGGEHLIPLLDPDLISAAVDQVEEIAARGVERARAAMSR